MGAEFTDRAFAEWVDEAPDAAGGPEAPEADAAEVKSLAFQPRFEPHSILASQARADALRLVAVGDATELERCGERARCDQRREQQQLNTRRATR